MDNNKINKQKTELIAEICNKLQRPKTALERLSKGEYVPQEFVERANKDLDEIVKLFESDNESSQK